jgi:GAF domain-containing protein
MNELLAQIEMLLKREGDPASAYKTVLNLILAQFQSETGTIHQLDREKQMLHLVAESGLPPTLLEVVTTIPVGKGIAGQTALRGGPVTICNLQADTSGVARPGARQTGVGGALCVPLLRGQSVVGTIGIGTLRQYEYTVDQTRALEEIGRLIGERLEQ